MRAGLQAVQFRLLRSRLHCCFRYHFPSSLSPGTVFFVFFHIHTSSRFSFKTLSEAVDCMDLSSPIHSTANERKHTHVMQPAVRYGRSKDTSVLLQDPSPPLGERKTKKRKALLHSIPSGVRHIVLLATCSNRPSLC